MSEPNYADVNQVSAEDLLPHQFEIAADLIDSPETNLQQEGVRIMAKAAFRAIKTEDGRSALAKMLRYSHNEKIGELISARDELKRANEDLERLSLYDSLTGLRSRNYLESFIETIKPRRQGVYPISIINMDVDNFKYINDTYGHPVGDKVLVSLAEVLRNTFREEDCIARAGGDEFIIPLIDTQEKDAKKLIDRFYEILANRNLEEEIPIQVSVGYAIAKKSSEVDEKIIEADDSMYEDKYKNGNKRSLEHLITEIES